jgi:hypothetical protein
MGKSKKSGQALGLDMPISPEMCEAARHPSKERLEESRQWWSKRYGRELTTEDAAEIHRNLFGLIKILVEHQIEQNRREAGGHVPDERRLQTLRYDIRHLEKQIEATDKMARHWKKEEAQRGALEQASLALGEQLAKKQSELRGEIVGPMKRS